MASVELEDRPQGLELRRAVTPWLPAGLMLCLAAAFYLPFPLNHDAAWIVIGAERLLDGGAFGREVIDVNPPLAWWLSVPGVVLARVGGIAPGAAFQLYVLAIGLGSLVLCAHLLRPADGQTPAVTVAAIAAVFWLLPAYDFGQREHLMAMLACPYVLVCARRGSGQPVGPAMAVVCGGLGGLAFCLKPYFLVIPIGLTLYTVLRTRRLGCLVATENMVIALVGAAYFAAILRFAPDYVSVVVPEAMIAYGAYANALLPVARSYLVLLAPAVVAVILLSRRFSGEPLPVAGGYMLFAGLLAAIAAVIQQKGWSYHIMPAIGFVVIATAIGLAGLVSRRGWRLNPAAGVACALVLLALVRPVQAHLRDLASEQGNQAVTAELIARLNEAGPKASVHAFITSPRNVHPAVLASGARWVDVACCAYLLPAHILDGDVSSHLARRAAAMRQMQGIIERLSSAPPDIILIDDRSRKLGFGGISFNYLAWLDGKPGFAELWAKYREEERAGHFRVFARKPTLGSKR